jgi:probable phosphoglycerate mutase
MAGLLRRAARRVDGSRNGVRSPLVLILVRHGQTAANAAGLLLGRADLVLTDVGRRQAKALAAALPVPAKVVSSPLRRAVETAEAIGLPVEIDERWIEIDYGDFDGLPLTEVGADVWKRWRSDPTFAPPNGESFDELDSRVREACEARVQEAAAHDVVVVSHVSPIKAAVAWALDVPGAIAWRMHLHVASVTKVAVGGPTPSLRTYNDTAHLPPPDASAAIGWGQETAGPARRRPSS